MEINTDTDEVEASIGLFESVREALYALAEKHDAACYFSELGANYTLMRLENIADVHILDRIDSELLYWWIEGYTPDKGGPRDAGGGIDRIEQIRQMLELAAPCCMSYSACPDDIQYSEIQRLLG